MTPRSSSRGQFITFEGGEGAGKSTQIKRLAETLQKRGHDVVLTREPGGSPGAEAIRKLLVEGEPGRWDGITETLLFAAARRDHVERTIRPALAQGSWVLCDRFMDSTIAYQGCGAGVDLALVRRISTDAAGDIIPDLTLILDLPVAVGLARAAGREGGEDRFERKGAEFHTRLRDGFLAIAKAEPHRCVVVNASGTPDAVAEAISKIVSERLNSAA